MWNPKIPKGNESAKIKYEIVPYTRGRVLDLGSGPWRTYPHFVTMDNFQEGIMNWKPDIIGDATDLSMFASGQFDTVFSSHLLEHIEDYKGTLKQWWRVVKTNGYLVLYLPHKDFYPNVGKIGSNINHEHDFTPKDIINAMKEVGTWDLIISDARNQDDEYSFLQVYQKKNNGHKFTYAKDKPGKTCAIVRYGGFGDMLQISPVFRSLKDEGYHVTLYTTPYAYDAIRFDPNIDEFVLQDKDQVPNQELARFWNVISKKYDKFINFSETVEGAFLALAGRAPYSWNQAARHFYMDRNYDEFTHIVAGVARKYKPKFYPTPKEADWAKKERKKIGGKLVMVVLVGSSLHKIYPWIDTVIARFMVTEPDVKFVFVGGESSKYLELPWREEPRVLRRSGIWSIRQTMTMAKLCDMVIGPETGILNSVSCETTPKVIYLSHSSKENLTKHWVNCTALEPECACHPCHKMVYTWNDCNRNEETGTAECATKIHPERIIEAISKWLLLEHTR